MKITITHLSEKGYMDNDERDKVKIESPNSTLYFHDGEIEDNTLGRNFSDVDKIEALLLETMTAVKAGEDIEIVHKEADNFY